MAMVRWMGTMSASLLCLSLSACALTPPGSVHESGGQAPKEIKSTALTSFELSFDDTARVPTDPGAYAQHPPGFYELSLVGDDMGCECRATCALGGIDGDKVVNLCFQAGPAALEGLQQLIRDHDVAQVNGVYLTAGAVKGATLLKASYASGERIEARAEGGAELPGRYFRTEWFVDYFRDLAQSHGLEFCNPLIMYADPKANRTLPDATVTSFTMSCEHDPQDEPGSPWPAGHYSMMLQPDAAGVLCSLTFQRAGSSHMSQLEFVAAGSVMDDLRVLLAEKEIAKLNGYQRLLDASVTQLWLQNDFSSGASIDVNAQGQGSAVKPYVNYRDDWFIGFFSRLAGKAGRDYPD